MVATTPVCVGIPWSRGRKIPKNAGNVATTPACGGIHWSRGREMPKNAGKVATTPVCGGIYWSRGREMPTYVAGKCRMQAEMLTRRVCAGVLMK